MKLFFILPTYNNSKFLADTVASLKKQTFSSWSARIFDNSDQPAEAENAKKLIESLNDPRVTYQKNNGNLGMVGNFNQGFDYAEQSSENFDAISILHSDDQITPDYAEKVIEGLLRNPEATFLFCKTKIIGANGKGIFSFVDWYKTLLLPTGTEFIVSGVSGAISLIPGNFIFAPTICYNAKKIKGRRFNEKLKMVFDLEFTLDILMSGGTLVGLYEKPLYLYRRHDGNATTAHNRSLLRFYEERDLYLKFANQLEKIGEHHAAKSARKLKVLKLNILFNLVKSILNFNFRGAVALFKFLRTI